MPPFRYEPFDPSRYAGSIGALLAHQNDAAMQAAEIGAQANARATEASGQAWGNAVGNIAATLGGIPQQMERAKLTAQETEIRDLQLQQAKRENRSRTVFETELRNPANYNEDGTINDQAVTAALKKADVGAWQQWSTLSAANQKNALEFREKNAQIQKTELETQEKQRLIDQGKTEYLGKLAYHAIDTLKQKPDDPLHARDTALAAAAVAASDGAISPQGAKAFLLRTSSASPQQLAQVLESFVPPDLKTKLDAEAAGRAKTQAETAKLTAEAGNLEKFGRATAPEAQHVTFRLDGKDVAGAFVPDPQGGKYFYNGQDVTARAQHIPAASVQIHNDQVRGGPGDYAKTGDDFLSTIPVQWRQTVKKIAGYEEDPTKVASMRSGMREQLMQWVNQVNPGYDASQFAQRAPMRRAFTSGPQSQTINSLNTAIEHLDQFVDVAKALGNGNFQPGNSAYNWLKSTFGDSAPTNFEGIKDIMSGELAAAFKKSGATDQEIASVKSAIASKNSTKQLVDYATTIAIPALGGKIASFNEQFHQVFGPNDPYKVVLPSAAAVLEKYGFDPEHPRMGGGANVAAAAPPAAGGFSVQAPNGKTYTFDSQAKLDAFKQSAGIR